MKEERKDVTMKRLKLKKMMLFLLLAGAFFCLLAEAHAQIGIQTRISQKSYLPFEPVFVRVSITNRAANALAFGNNDKLKGSLRFEITPLDAPIKSPLPLKDPGVYPPLTGSIIPPGATREYTFNLCDYYDLQQPGRYVIKAVMKHNLLHHEYLSDPAYITIVKGQTVWSAEVGLPSLTGKSAEEEGKIKLRRYSILSYNTGSSLVYNLQVDDDNMVYANRRVAFNLGPELAPQCQIDFLSRLHVIFAANSKVFAYYVFTPDGRLDERKILVRIDAIPRLSVDPKSGFVTAVGGREARPDQDYEEIRDLPFLGLKGKGAASVPVPPKGDSIRDLNAVPD